MRLIMLTISRLTSLLLLGSSLSWTIATYQPPPDQERTSDRSKSTGIRQDCPNITVLAPKIHVGRTVSPSPSLAWVITDVSRSDTDLKMNFKMGEFTPDGELAAIGETVTLPISPGVMKVSPRSAGVALTIGKKYLWQVSIRCPEGMMVARAEIRRVETPANLQSGLSSATTTEEKVDRFAAAGIWYDALSIALEGTDGNRWTKPAIELIRSLLQVEKEQIDRPDSNLKPSEKRQIGEQIGRLETILNSNE
jgi:Domain of Unknown Function (DUF928)